LVIKDFLCLPFRWVKYEQTIDPESNMWSKPFIGPLIYQNLIYLKNNLQYGTIILNSQQETIEGVVEELLHDFIGRGHMNRDHKDNLKGIILSQHRNNQTIASTLAGKKAPLSELFSLDGKHSKFSSNHSFLTEQTGSHIFRKNYSFQSAHNYKPNKIDDQLNSSDNNLDDKVSK
jgi:hypothetical protein